MRRLGFALPHTVSKIGKREPKCPKQDGSRPAAKGNSQREYDNDARNGNYVGKLVRRQGIIPYRSGSLTHVGELRA